MQIDKPSLKRLVVVCQLVDFSGAQLRHNNTTNGKVFEKKLRAIEPRAILCGRGKRLQDENVSSRRYI